MESQAAKGAKHYCCPICLSEVSDSQNSASDSSILDLTCRHKACYACLKQQLEARWPGKRITFNFLKCPICRELIEHPDLSDIVAPHRELQTLVQELSLEKCLREELIENLTDLAASDRNNALAVAGDEVACFICTDCNKPFAAGRVDCAALDGIEKTGHIRCNECQWKMPSPFKCSIHPNLCDAIIKCNFCCDIAQYQCGSGVYCHSCHTSPLASSQPLFDPKAGGSRKVGQGQVCPGPDGCPLGVPHPMNGGQSAPFVTGCTYGCKR